MSDQSIEIEGTDRLDGIRVGGDGNEGPPGTRLGEHTDASDDVPVIGQAVTENQADSD